MVYRALPNGHKAHFYFSGKAVSDPIDAKLSDPPRRPAETGDVRQELPVADIMRDLSLPKLESLSGFRPKPMLPKAPPPPFALPAGIAEGGDGMEDEATHLQIFVTGERITKQETYLVGCCNV